MRISECSHHFQSTWDSSRPTFPRWLKYGHRSPAALLYVAYRWLPAVEFLHPLWAISHQPSTDLKYLRRSWKKYFKHDYLSPRYRSKMSCGWGVHKGVFEPALSFRPGRSAGLEMGDADQRGCILPFPGGCCTFFSCATGCAGELIHPRVDTRWRLYEVDGQGLFWLNPSNPSGEFLWTTFN